MEILLANPRGFCAGVDRAISIVERALDIFEKPIYVRHEVVHNRYVVDGLKNRGAVFVEELDQVPDDSIVILVTRASRKGIECILIGHHGHPEVEGTMGQYDNQQGGIYLVETVDDVLKLDVKNADNLFYCSQTTLSVDDTADVIDALRSKFPAIDGPRKDDICYATQNRQDAVRDLADKVDVLLVVGAKNSSNSNRLRELADKMGTRAYLIDDASNVEASWFDGINSVGVTAGASAPEVLVQQVITRLKELGGNQVTENPGEEENIVFAVPVELR